MSNEEIKFLPLTPDESKEGKEGYIDALKWAIDQESVKNIAITGTYGSGKSSLVRTYIKEKGLENVLEVSVATFNSSISENDDNTNDGRVDREEKDSSLENRLEQHILQQMFYTVKAEDIPNSRFSRLQVGNKKGAWCRFVDNFFNVLAIVFLVIAIKYSAARQLVNIYKDNSFIDKDYFWIVTVVMVLVVIFVSWRSIKIIQYLKEIGLNKLNIGTTSIELNSEDNVSIFNKYIDEIIYLFTNTNYNLVVFEDLDRFENLEIFERLRSMNTLINNNKDIKAKGRKIVFVYALKDDIFSINDLPEESQARTKFFDFIIPTVKVLSWSNTEEKLLEYLGDESKHNINRELITGISLFINDMRTLKNICNEFKIIKQALNNSALIDSKIFAMSVYKNLYPKDYTDLLNEKGIVYEVFKNKHSIIEQLTSQLKYEKNQIEKILSNVENEFLLDIEAIYFILSKRKAMNTSVITIEGIGNQQCQINLTSSADLNNLFSKIEQMEKNNYSIEEMKIKYNRRTSNNWRNSTEESVEAFFTDNGTSKDLYVAYKTQKVINENKLIETEKRFEEINRNINQIKAQSIKGLFNELQDSVLIDFKEAKLIGYLIREGWISEDYTQYITYFYEGVWTLKDQEFLQSVFGGNIEEFDYPLTNVKKVLEKIPGDKISSKSIYNLQLFEFIFSGNPSEINEELKAKKGVLIDYLNRNLNETITFLQKVIEKGENNHLVGLVMKNLTENLTSLWTEIHNVAITRNTKVEFLSHILSVFTEDQLIAINSESDLREFISESKDILTWDKIIDSFEEWELKFKAIGVKIKAFDGNTDISSDIGSKILRNGIYDVNLNILKQLLKVDTIKYKTLTDNSDITTYVSENLKAYVEVLIAQNQYEEDQESMILLMNEDIDLDLKKDLLKVWSAKLETISGIENEDVKLEVINHDKLCITLENVLILPKQIECAAVWSTLNEKVFNNTSYLSELIQTVNNLEVDVYKEKRQNFTEQICTKSEYSYENFERIAPLLVPVEYKSEMDRNMLGNFVRCKLIEPFSSEALNDLHRYSDSGVERDIFINYLIEGIELLLAGNIELNNILNLDEAYLLIEKVEENCLEETMAYLLANEIEINKDLINKYMERMDGESKPEVLRQILNSMVNNDDFSTKNKLEILVRNKGLLYQLESLEEIKLNELVGEDSEQLAEEIIAESNISKEFKERVLDNFVENHLNDISNKILRFILKEEVTISYENLLLLAQHYEDGSTVAKVLYKLFSTYNINQEDLATSMSALKTEHKILAEKGYGLTLKNKNYNQKIMEVLEQDRLVFNSKIDGNLIVFDTLSEVETTQV